MAGDSRPAKSRVEVWHSFLVAHARIVTELERELAEERSLPLTWYDVLFQLADGGGRLRMQELAGRLVIPRSSLTRQIDRMAAAGLVERESTDEDGRGTVAVLTAEGRPNAAPSRTRAPPGHRRALRRQARLPGRRGAQAECSPS